LAVGLVQNAAALNESVDSSGATASANARAALRGVRFNRALCVGGGQQLRTRTMVYHIILHVCPGIGRL